MYFLSEIFQIARARKIKTHPVIGWVLSRLQTYRFSQRHTRKVQLRQQQHKHRQVAERTLILKTA
jgi:hypothetical protein